MNLFKAASEGKIEVVKSFLKYCNNPIDINEINKEGNTALMLAAQSGHNDIVTYLINNNADINIKNKWGNTALILAIDRHQTNTILLLLKHRANIHIKNFDGFTAKDIAINYGYKEYESMLDNKVIINNVIDEQPQTTKLRKKRIWSWKIDKTDLENQVDNYDTLKFNDTYRGTCIIQFIIIWIMNFVLNSNFMEPIVMIDGLLMIYLTVLFFVNKGHLWAIVLIMALWTLEKGYLLYTLNQHYHGKGASQVFWWLIIMRYFWKTFRVEVERRRIARINEIVNN